MKKSLLIILALMTAIILTACGGDGDAVTSGDVSEDLTPAELPVTVASKDSDSLWAVVTDTTDVTEEPAVTTSPESDETEATTTEESDSTTATTTTASTTTAATTTTASTTTASTTTAATTTTADEDEEEVEILWEDGISRDEFEAMLGIDSDEEVDVNG
ncbi:MAG: hypothetical protein LUH18_04520 [Oscillospiraceae bacterium]|nr:hypothetical protein [Oscillospiraceae bacterium]